MKPSFNKRYDIEGIDVLRLARVTAWSKVVPMGNFRGGPGARCLVVLIVLHYLGYPLYFLFARYGHRLRLLRRIAVKLKA
jgi:hypothetical protein